MNTPGKSHGRLSIKATAQPRELMSDRPELAQAWTARVITLFPQAFPGVLGASLTGKALDQGLWQLQPIDLRPFGIGKHRNVDDTPAGGGAGMVCGRPLGEERRAWRGVQRAPRARRSASRRRGSSGAATSRRRGG